VVCLAWPVSFKGHEPQSIMNPRAYGHVSADQQKVMSWPEVCRGTRRWDGTPQTDRADPGYDMTEARSSALWPLRERMASISGVQDLNRPADRAGGQDQSRQKGIVIDGARRVGIPG
jgi:hypothetical protein